MAISVENTYPGRSNVGDANYPEGSIKNEVVPDVSNDGTPLDELWGNDYEGLKQAILRSAGIVPVVPGNIPDTAIASQQLQGLIEMIQGRAINYDETGVADAYVLGVLADQQAPAGLFNHQKFSFVAGNDNTGVSTIDLLGLGGGVKDIVNAIDAGAILAGNYYEVEYRTGTDDVEILNVKNPDEITSITGTVAASALTVGLKESTLKFRNSSLPSGISNLRSFGDLSLVVPSGATLGAINAIQSRLILLAIDNGGVIELAIVNLAGGNNLDETTLISTTAIDVTADSNNVIYSTTARANVPFRVVGYIESTQAVAGTWATIPSTLQGAGGNALTAMNSLGYGQTWTTVTRVTGTTYYNTTGRPITLSLGVVMSLSNGNVLVTVNGSQIGATTATTVGWMSSGIFIIPPNASYSFVPNGGTVTAYSIVEELR